VERVLSESGEPLRHRSSPVEQSKRVETILKGECQKGKISFEELRMGGARLLGVSTLAISKILHRIA
jgi:hypothetical protein